MKLGDKQVVSGGSDGQEGGKADFFLSRKDCYKKKKKLKRVLVICLLVLAPLDMTYFLGSKFSFL